MRSLAIMNEIILELNSELVAILASLQIGCFEVNSLLLEFGYFYSVDLAFC